MQRLLASRAPQNQRLNSSTSLRRAFEATPEISETPERTRERYIDAIDSVADYLESIGADAVWVERFDELSGALEDLVDGRLPAVLRPAIRRA